eukprot:365152-Chlamydomonas_euryale.AAC.11
MSGCQHEGIKAGRCVYVGGGVNEKGVGTEAPHITSGRLPSVRSPRPLWPQGKSPPPLPVCNPRCRIAPSRRSPWCRTQTAPCRRPPRARCATAAPALVVAARTTDGVRVRGSRGAKWIAAGKQGTGERAKRVAAGKQGTDERAKGVAAGKEGTDERAKRVAAGKQGMAERAKRVAAGKQGMDESMWPSGGRHGRSGCVEGMALADAEGMALAHVEGMTWPHVEGMRGGSNGVPQGMPPCQRRRASWKPSAICTE